MFIRTNVKLNITVIIRDTVQATAEQRFERGDHFCLEKLNVKKKVSIGLYGIYSVVSLVTWA